jgi:hypothetical protein
MNLKPCPCVLGALAGEGVDASPAVGAVGGTVYGALHFFHMA